jgi:RND family efflux transporter MFP subunit
MKNAASFVGIALLVAVAAAVAFAVGRGSSNTAPAGGTAPAATSAKQLWTCSMHPQVVQDHPGQCPICHMELTPVRSAEGDSHAITIDPAMLQNMGVRTAVVAKGPLVSSVRVVGYLEEPEPLHRDINLRVNGWIEKLYADTDGMVITEGKPLFDLYSPELTVAVDELIAARKQSAGAAANGTQQSLVDAGRRKLQQFGLTDKQIDELSQLEAAPRNIPILAPISGHLTAKMVYEGAAVKAGDLVLRLASRHQMWIDAQVYEQQMPLISDGQPARATLVSQPGKTFEGKVLFIHPHVDPSTRTALVRIEIPNGDLSLRQGMYATVEILADNYVEALLVPREAVIDSGRKQVAFVDLGEGRFEPRSVTLGMAGQDGQVQVLSGLREGERVVTSGQFLLDSESRMREALAKFGSTTTPEQARADQPIAMAPSTTHAHAGATTSPIKVVVPHTDDIVKEYLALAKAFGARQESDRALDVSPLADATVMAAEHASGDAKPLAEAVHRAAKVMVGQSLDEQRRKFIDLSNAVVALVRVSPPSKDAVPSLYLMNCPMAFDLGEAHWLQDSDSVANPYYATTMKKCGSVVETFAR